MGMYRLRRRGLLIVSLLFMLAVHANAQLEYTNWIFGRGGGLRFNDGRGVLVTPPVGFPGTMLVTDGETSAWSDPCTGELELYSDGHSIRNARHDVIEGGDGVGGIGNTFSEACWEACCSFRILRIGIRYSWYPQ